MIQTIIKHTQIEDIQVIYRVLGDCTQSEKILLVLHGWNTTGSGIWQNFILQFQVEVQKGNVCVIAPDLPGFAESSPPTSVWNVEQYADFVEKFLTSLDIKDLSHVTLLGHSFGGGISSILAARHSFAQIYLVTPAIIRNSKLPSANLIQTITKLAKKIVKNPLLKKIWYKLIGSPDYAKTTGIMKNIFRVVVAHDLQSYLPQINSKTTIIWGDKDTYTPIWQAEVIHAQIPNSQLIILPNINHGVHIYAADKLYQIVKD
jgi:pimeloyl-ACP methyl ester carboxylesterase